MIVFPKPLLGKCSLSQQFLNNFYVFIYFGCSGSLLPCEGFLYYNWGEWAYSLVAVRWHLLMVASLDAELGPRALQASVV